MVNGLEGALGKAKKDVKILQAVLAHADKKEYGARSPQYVVGMALGIKRDEILKNGYDRSLRNQVDEWYRRVRTNPDNVTAAMNWEPTNDEKLERIIAPIRQLQETYLEINRGIHNQQHIIYAAEVALSKRMEELKLYEGGRTSYNAVRNWIGNRAAAQAKPPRSAGSYSLELQTA